MPLDTSIAMGYKPVQMPNQLANYAQMQQILGGQQAQQLNALKMQEAQAAMQERNALRGLNPADPDYFNQLSKVNPQLGLNYLKEKSAAEQSKAATLSSTATAQKTNIDNSRSLLVGVNDQPTYDAWRAYSVSKIPELANILPAQFTPETKDSLLRTADDISKRLTAGPTTVAAGGSVYNPATKTFTQAPEKTPVVAPTELQRNYEYAQKQGFKGDIFNYEKAIKEAGRPPAQPAQPVAPTITQIVDPTNPNQMITVDAKRYQGGGAGSAGVIGVGGKEPGAALRQNKIEAGKTQLNDDLENLRASFEALDKMRAIPSTERNVISNIGSATSASGFGQMLGRAGGTTAQVERDVINSARMRLVNSIKNATGMSAQQLNSNVELQTMLKSISDPGQSVQAAMRIIDDIQNAYVNGTGELPKRSQSGKVTSTPAAAPGKLAPASNIDALLNKYR